MRPQRTAYSQLLTLAILVIFLSVSGSSPRILSAEPSEPDWAKLQAEALDLFIRYLRIDTTNPPGGEIAAARFFASICAKEGIEHQVFEPFPGRGTLWARVKGDGTRRPLVLLNHTDVVPHSREFWTVDPFAAVEKNEQIYGRGAQDMKPLGIAQFVTLLAIKRSGILLKRDIIFLATADEEAGGGQGAGWFAKNQSPLLGNAEFLLNEGGDNRTDDQGVVKSIGIGPSEKTPVWIRLTAKGPAGHASLPIPGSAVNRLLRALARLQDYKPPIQLAPVVEAAFHARARMEPEPLASKYRDIRESIKDKDFLASLEADPRLSALLRNTISITMLSGSTKVNVISPSAYADVDTRIIPGEKIDRWITELKRVINDDSIEIQKLLTFEANASPTNSELVAAIARFAKKKYPGAAISFPVLLGFTDSHYFRDLGIQSYGFEPFVGPERTLGGGYHGNDERIGKQAFIDGVRNFYDVVMEISR
jgi:acetylornithine deacetylase/succinyl-diaminopimelate desuccinylase-like protein